MTSPTPAVRKIIHIDMDAFYASVEQRDDPRLRGLPVAVGGAAARGVVAAASYEARRFGVHSAMPSVTARRKCPALIFIRPRFEVYRAISGQIRAILLDYTDLVEPLSLDEAYLDVTADKRGIGSATRIAGEIRARIKAETGLTASAGVSYNKFLAKLASDHRKPDGLFVITPDQGAGFVETLDIAKFHGIGPATARRMHQFGIRSGLDLRGAELGFLQRHFGKAGSHYHNIARGIDERRVTADRPRKSISAENTFADDLHALPAAAAELAPLADKVWAYCGKTGTRGRTVTLKVKFSDFRQQTRSRTQALPIAGRDELLVQGTRLLEPLFPVRRGIRLLGLGISSIAEAAGEDAAPQLGLSL
ncbi:DNA polymerase IV [Zavarzinia compransoris]|uniref:DNA polymerase IV n=1 Tax=Zavarzinia compransoris TaxID=1264899 RepID=A0A317DZ83_9PROT|nr:DNA polymerase IV [Zavarzinia compransoris]PWR20097.1 DNA polymerase IV [Zavarzinia compransoris]TDP43389.1 DNA polymerase-4 [Zavarzinia compransoris]